MMFQVFVFRYSDLINVFFFFCVLMGFGSFDLTYVMELRRFGSDLMKIM